MPQEHVLEQRVELRPRERFSIVAREQGRLAGLADERVFELDRRERRERGERVHDAMAARGFTGTMPTFSEASTTRNDWLLAAVPAVVSLVGFTIVGLT